VYETSIVLYIRRGTAGIDALLDYLEVMDAHIASFDRPLAEAALAAYITYGKGINPQSRLNLCDCVSYALAKSLNVPLLYKGFDFGHTDVVPCS
jgi:ribonuclease VapC